jgi:hypothetical protein
MGRVRRALLGFQAAHNQLLGAHRRLKGQPQSEVAAAFQRFSTAGLVAAAGDRHLVTQAQRYLAAGAACPSASSGRTKRGRSKRR